MYCPEWIFDAAVAQTGLDFLAQDLPLSTYAAKYASGLSEKYEAVSADDIETAAEEMIRSLDEIDAGEQASYLLNSFCFFRVMYVSQEVKRRLKPFFGTVDAPEKTKSYSADSTIKRFRAYLFAWRSGVAVAADASWKLENVSEVEILSALAVKKISFADML